MVTDKAIRKGRQVYLNYETYPSHFYLLHYGFVAVSNIHDCLLVPLPNATSLSPLLRQVLQALGFPSDDTVCLDFTRFLNDKALAFFLLRRAPDEHLAAVSGLLRQGGGSEAAGPLGGGGRAALRAGELGGGREDAVGGGERGPEGGAARAPETSGQRLPHQHRLRQCMAEVGL